MNITNASTLEESQDCDLQINPWCGSFGLQQYIEIVFLCGLVVLGVLGNSIVVFSILLAGKTNKHGNAFIINLAIADVLVTGIYTPTVIVNVLAQGPGLPHEVCQGFGYIIIAACAASMWNLAFIALNRYWAVAKRPNYVRYFTSRNVIIMIVFVWVWSNLLVIPTLLGWTQLEYDYNSMVCAWDDRESLGYSIFIVFGAIIIPLASTVYCYIRLFLYVRHKRRKMTMQRRSHIGLDIEVSSRRINHQISLIKTLVTAVAVFVLCWTPYAIVVLFLRENADPLTEKICTWLGLCNSTVNFVIYGVLNRGFRDGYRRLLTYLFCRYKHIVILAEILSVSTGKPDLFSKFRQKFRLEKKKYFSRQSSVMSRV